jgi:hypothetical protein
MDREKSEQHEDQGKENVAITIDDSPLTVHRGHHTVAGLKTLAGIPLAYDLDWVIDGKFEPLPDDGGVTIKGGEIFISHVKDGSSA